MQALIDFIIRNLLALWPIARIYSWQQGVRVRNGKLREQLSPGLHWRWWFVDEVRTWPSTEVTIDLGVGAITTSDGKPVALSANLSYRVTSIRQMHEQVWNTEESLKHLSLGIITASACGYTRDDLHRERVSVEAQLLARINEVTIGWGVLVTRVHLTDFADVRALRLFGDGFKAA